MQVNELLTVPISDLELGGKAVGRHDGRVVFVDRGLPGDQVVVRVTRAKRTFAEARLERVERPSPDRVPAPCPHAERCGGCRFQELRYERQLEIKERLTRETLVRHLPITGECAVHLVAADGEIAALETWAREVAALSPAVRAVSLLLNRTRANVATGEERVLVGSGVIVERLGGLEFEVSGTAFLQTNSRQADALYARALEAASLE